MTSHSAACSTMIEIQDVFAWGAFVERHRQQRCQSKIKRAPTYESKSVLKDFKCFKRKYHFQKISIEREKFKFHVQSKLTPHFTYSHHFPAFSTTFDNAHKEQFGVVQKYTTCSMHTTRRFGAPNQRRVKVKLPFFSLLLSLFVFSLDMYE